MRAKEIPDEILIILNIFPRTNLFSTNIIIISKITINIYIYILFENEGTNSFIRYRIEELCVLEQKRELTLLNPGSDVFLGRKKNFLSPCSLLLIFHGCVCSLERCELPGTLPPITVISPSTDTSIEKFFSFQKILSRRRKIKLAQVVFSFIEKFIPDSRPKFPFSRKKPFLRFFLIEEIR